MCVEYRLLLCDATAKNPTCSRVITRHTNWPKHKDYIAKLRRLQFIELRVLLRQVADKVFWVELLTNLGLQECVQ